MLNEQDNEGYTVAHYASELGFVTCLKILIIHGADLTIKNLKNQSALHLSALHGRYNSCLEILNSNNFKNCLNEKDANGILCLS